MQPITLNQLAVALLGAGAYVYHISQRAGWTACAIVCGTRIERSNLDPYAALGAVAQVLIDYEAQQTAQDAHDTPAARAAYKTAWATSEGQPVPARFAAAEAAAAATESAEWPSTIRTEQDNASTMQRLRSITGRASAAEVAPAANSDEQLAEDEDDEEEGACCDMCDGRGLGGRGCPQCGTKHRTQYQDEAEYLYRQEQRLGYENGGKGY